MAQKTPDQIAREAGFPSAAAMIAFHNRQQMIQQLPAQTMAPQQQAAPHPAQSWLDTILSYLPLAHAMKQAGDVMGGKK